MPKEAEYDEEIAKFFLLTEEIIISAKNIGVFDKNPDVALRFVDCFLTDVLTAFANETTIG